MVDLASIPMQVRIQFSGLCLLGSKVLRFEG